ncbi:transport protein Avl9-domain-containing protein [Entophlyctis helioformis]|nr:transport protein Avl9-domain-containing protein [Entophlyctis helioformis]
MVEYAHPPFPNSTHTRRTTDSTDTKMAVDLPDEWSFMPFMCLPDGAHATEEEFIYFHLPPVPAWQNYPQSTLFGLACFRQIDAKDLINKTADVTRTKVQKAVVVLATQPILGSIRSKLGLVTQAFFAQRDFTKIEILDTLYESLDLSVRMPFTDATLYMGISLRELLFKFRHKTLQLLKLLILGKRVLFFGQKVERLSGYQYGLISLVPELLRHLEDVGSPALDNREIRRPAGRKISLTSSARSMELLRQHNTESHKYKLGQLGHPLRVFGFGAFFQPYVPLQQIDVIMSPVTKSFLVGTSNAIFTHHKACAIDAVAYADNGNLEFTNPQVTQLVNLTAADRKFMDELLKPVLATWSAEDDMTFSQQIDFEGSDEDIRARFETYLTQLFASIQYDIQEPAVNPETGARKVDYVSEYGAQFVKAWEGTRSYSIWREGVDQDALSMINPGHPFHGYSTLGEMSTNLSARLTELGKTMAPLPTTFGRAFSTASSTVTSTVAASVTDAVTIISDPAQQQKIQGRQQYQAGQPSSASSLFSNVSAWYSSKRKEWTAPQPADGSIPISANETDADDGYRLIESPGSQQADSPRSPGQLQQPAGSVASAATPTPGKTAATTEGMWRPSTSTTPRQSDVVAPPSVLVSADTSANTDAHAGAGAGAGDSGPVLRA